MASVSLVNAEERVNFFLYSSTHTEYMYVVSFGKYLVVVTSFLKVSGCRPSPGMVRLLEQNCADDWANSDIPTTLARGIPLRR
jgi:hypothetical protein